MAKRRKTRKEKTRSDTRRVATSSSSSIDSKSPVFTFTPSSSKTTLPPATVAVHQYQYLSYDLKKILILTSSIIIAELVLAFIIKL